MVIIDEISMLGRSDFDNINRRLQEIMCRPNEFFGGLHVLFVGDLYQLPPSGKKYLFTENQFGNPWADHIDFFELTEIMRQKDDAVFAKALNRVREGDVTEADLDLFRTRITDKVLDLPYIFAFHEPKDAFTNLAMTSFSGEQIILNAKDKFVGEYTDSMRDVALAKIAAWKPQKTGKLVKALTVKLGLPVVLVSYVDVADGLCNGNSGILRGVSGPSGRSEVMWVEFKDATIGAKLRSKPTSQNLATGFRAARSWTPISKVTFSISHSGEICKPFENPFFQRTQFPLDLAGAITVHASQGSTYDTIGVDLVKHKPQLSMKAGQVYTAYSRCRTLQGLFLTQVEKNDIKVSQEVKQEMHRMRTHRRIKYSCPEFSSEKGNLQLYSRNVRSFRKHKLSILKTPEFREAPVVFLQETRCSVSQHLHHDPRSVIEVAGGNNVGSGIAFVLAQDITVLKTDLVKPDQDCRVEAIAVEIATATIPCVQIIGIYCPPKQALRPLLSTLETLMHASHAVKPTILVGDFNVDLNEPGDQRTAQLCGGLGRVGLTASESPVTRVVTGSSTRIDHIWVSAQLACSVEVGFCHFSDHSPLYAYFENAVSV